MGTKDKGIGQDNKVWKKIFKKEDEKKHSITKQLIDCLVIVFFIVLFDCVYLKFNTILNGDEYTSIAVPVYFAGIDWKSLTSWQSFHGYGFTIFLTPIYWLFKSANFYQAYLFQNLIIRCINGILVYYIGGCILGDERIKKVIVSIISDVCSIGFMGGVLICGVEASLTLITLAIALLILKSKGDLVKAKILIPIAFLTAYTFTLHARASIFIAATILIYLLWLLNNLKQWKRIVFFLGYSIFFLVIFYFLHKYVLSLIFVPTERHGGAVVNTMSSFVNENVFGQLSIEMIVYVIEVFFSIFCSYIFYSFGIICPVLVVIIQSLISSRKNSKSDLSSVYAYIYVIISWVIVIALYSGKGAYEVYINQNYKPLSFIRYGIPYAYVIMVFGLFLLFKQQVNRKYLIISFIAGILLCKIYTIIIAPQFKGRSQITYFQYFILGREDRNFSFYFSLLLVFVVMSGIGFIVISGKKQFFPYGVIILYFSLSMIARWDNYKFWNNNYAEACARIDASSRYISEQCLSGNDNLEIGLMGSINYCKGMQMKNPLIPFVYMTNEEELEEMGNENVYVFSDLKVEDNDDWVIKSLDENEYLLTRKNMVKENE